MQEARSKKQEARSKKQEARSKKQEARSKKYEVRAAEGFRTDHGYTINVPIGVLLHHNSYLSFSELEEHLASN
ncbi:hypothetical protein BJP46_21100 [Paenibacillus odorifer]|nr:hypothetical protein BJP46_21100 [Paenibacillus odorifer]